MMPSRSCSGVKVALRAGLKAMRAGFSNGERPPTSRPVGPCTLVVSWACDAPSGSAAPTMPAEPARSARRRETSEDFTASLLNLLNW